MTQKSQPSPFEEHLRRQIEAYHEAALVHAAVTLDLPDKMGDRAWTAGKLAPALGVLPESLHRLLRGLVTVGVCEERPDGKFALTADGEKLKSGAPSRLREKVQIVVEQYWRPWADLASCLRTGYTAFAHAFGTDVTDWRRAHPAQDTAFNAYAADETFRQAAPVVAALDLSGVRTVAAIGGGYGGLLAALLRAHPELEGILFDTPEATRGAADFLQAHGVAQRVRVVSGDYFTDIPVAADLYVLPGVLQNWTNAKARTLLTKVRAAMSPGAKLVIVERLIPERAADDPDAIMLDLHMLAITGGRLRRLDEFETLLAHANFALGTVTNVSSGATVIEAHQKA